MRDDTGAPDLSQALGLAAGIFSSAQGDASAPSAPTSSSADQPTPLPTNQELADRLAQLMRDQPTGKPIRPASSEPDEAASATGSPGSPEGPAQPVRGSLDTLAAVLPPLLQAISGNGDLVKPEKLNLVRAFQPYLSAERNPGIDRAVRMANIALAAKSALSALGR